MGTGALLFFVGLRAGQGRPISSAIALLIEATYLATLGAGTASWRGYTSGLNPPFWVAMGLAAIAVPLLFTAWFSPKYAIRVRGSLGATILGVGVSVGICSRF